MAPVNARRVNSEFAIFTTSPTSIGPAGDCGESGLGPANIAVYSGGLPYPTELAGTRVTFTPAAGGAVDGARFTYALGSAKTLSFR
jgi:hypothetical protein